MTLEMGPDPEDSRPWPIWRGSHSLSAIITAARGGAIDHAWAMFRAAGYDQRDRDAAALAVKGRLLKEKALRAAGEARAHLLVEAAAAYGATDRIMPQLYAQANLATLSLLAGDVVAADAAAGDLLAWLASAPDSPEPPYHRAAVRAEALLVLGEDVAAGLAFAEAIACAPRAWADHAATLRQLRLIAAVRGSEPGWLARFQPPRMLHFAGHLGIGAESEALLAETVDRLLREEAIGFGYGALAAGAEIVIAERILHAGAELHVILPTDADNFARQSVLRYGQSWPERFRHCLAGATSIRSATRVTGGYEPLATVLAADLAMGAAVLNAGRLASEPVQLLVADEGAGPFGDGIGTIRMGSRWRETGRRQHVIRIPRSARISASGHPQHGGRPDRRLAALLHITFDGLDALDEGAFAEVLDEIIGPLREKMAAFPIQPALTLPAGNARLAAFADTDSAWAYARLLLAEPPSRHPLRIAGHFMLAHWLDAPAALIGHGVVELDVIASGAMPGVLTVSEAMASSLFVGAPDGLRAEPVGEVAGIRLFVMAQD